MFAVDVCLKTGWTYEQFQDLPDWFVELIVRKYQMDAQRDDRK